jgi:hypothetical protein
MPHRELTADSSQFARIRNLGAEEQIPLKHPQRTSKKAARPNGRAVKTANVSVRGFEVSWSRGHEVASGGLSPRNPETPLDEERASAEAVRNPADSNRRLHGLNQTLAPDLRAECERLAISGLDFVALPLEKCDGVEAERLRVVLPSVSFRSVLPRHPLLATRSSVL